MEKIKVLYLAANPVGTGQLQLDEEIHQITAQIRGSEHRDLLELVPRLAVRPDDLTQALLEVNPHVVHFGGHGNSAQELILLDKDGNPKPVSTAALVHLFQTIKGNVRVVVLNACNSQPQAAALAKVVECTIGMSKPIGDRAAIVFAASFYRAVGFGLSVKDAFELGRAALLLERIPEDKTPKLISRKTFDAARLVLVNPPAASGPDLRKPAGDMARLDLVRKLGSLSPVEWGALLAATPEAVAWIDRDGTVAERAAELVHWAEGTTGPGLAAVRAAADGLEGRGETRGTPPRPAPGVTPVQLSDVQSNDGTSGKGPKIMRSWKKAAAAAALLLLALAPVMYLGYTRARTPTTVEERLKVSNVELAFDRNDIKKVYDYVHDHKNHSLEYEKLAEGCWSVLGKQGRRLKHECYLDEIAADYRSLIGSQENKRPFDEQVDPK